MKDLASKKTFILLLDAIRVINIINFNMLLGLWLSFIGLNRYFNLIIVLISCIIITNISQKYFIKKFGQQNLLVTNKLYRILSICFFVVILIYYLASAEYFLALFMLTFFSIYYFWIRNRQKILSSKF